MGSLSRDLLMRRIAELLPERYRGAYGPGSEGETVVTRQQPGAEAVARE